MIETPGAKSEKNFKNRIAPNSAAPPGPPPIPSSAVHNGQLAYQGRWESWAGSPPPCPTRAWTPFPPRSCPRGSSSHRPRWPPPCWHTLLSASPGQCSNRSAHSAPGGPRVPFKVSGMQLLPRTGTQGQAERPSLLVLSPQRRQAQHVCVGQQRQALTFPSLWL